MKKVLLLLAIVALVVEANAQVKSPEQFLGYKIGERFTPHAQIVNYFNHVASQAGDLMKIQEYGKTNEGRPLLLSFISSAENLRNLETIHQNNLRLANISKDRAMPTENTPVIVWLSYNVHGNEPSSSEAAMLTLHALIDPSNTAIREWLKNTVVIIDPCMNPDGRDRYVNWFNSVSGKKYNPLPEAREHDEPWPGGRTNHYNFDLNRDWLWQTQVESQQRLKVYNSWMPQVHVDFHEQGVDQPYYFAPAAQPFHEVVTTWQRDFQLTIGKNHAKYFDEKGWLYFTKEVFDLYYPSYGDTYPMYNGAIGMTYEQGGGPAGGLGIITGAGDTLTLYDRALHHYTTSISTIETCSKNAASLIKEFRKFFNSAVSNPTGEYRSYVIKYDSGNEQKLRSLASLLERNGIQYQLAGAGNEKNRIRGFNYSTGKEENFTIGVSDMVVNTSQPRSAMVKVLFEPKSVLVDSNTYDITAWSLPYIYGLPAFAAKTTVTVPVNSNLQAFVKNSIQDTYGYVIKWEGTASAKVLARLLEEKVRVRFSEQPFEVNGQKFQRGSLILLKTSNQATGNLWQKLAVICDEFQVRMYPVTTGFVDKGYDFGSSKVHPVKTPRVLLLTGSQANSNAAGQVWHFFEEELKYPVTLINADEFSSASFKSYDVIIMPDGNYKMLSDRQSAEHMKEWVRGGGKLIALQGALEQIAQLGWGIKLKADDDSLKDAKKDPYQLLHSYQDRERDVLRTSIPGSIFKVQLDNTHPLAFGYPSFYYTLKQDDKLYEYLADEGWNVGVIKKQNQVAGFIGSGLKEKLQDGLLFGVLPMGDGNVVMLTDNPLFRNFWENGKLLFCNALFLVGQ